MNLETVKNKKNQPTIANDFSMDDFDFKPITSGLGFHQKDLSEIKAAFTERAVPTVAVSTFATPVKKEMNVYQNDLSLFYGQSQVQPVPENRVDKKEEKTYSLASKPQRFYAYLTDLFFVASVLGIVLTVMARTISMDLMVVWEQFPHEITPLVVTLFCGFYFIYFSIFEKSVQSTLGKNIFNLRVTGLDNKTLPFSALVVRSLVSLLNFASLGLFSYFDLQNKVTHSKVIRND